MNRRRLVKLITALVVALVAYAAARAVPNATPASMLPAGDFVKVVEVYDGDTIAVNLRGSVEKVRFLGVDTPETHDPRKPVQCFGREASDWTKQALTGRFVRLESDPAQGERDKYGRLLAYIWRDDGVMINQSLISEGYAHEYTYQVPYKYQQLFRELETAAQEQQRGLWSPTSCNGDTKQPAR